MKKNLYHPSSRSNIDSFYVMDLLYNANKLEANGKKIFHLELGEPQPATPLKVLRESSRLSKLKLPGYTPSNGILALREAVSEHIYYEYNSKITMSGILAYLFKWTGDW